MDVNRIAALQAERNEVVDFCKALSPEDWSRPSRCEGWTVQDVIAHMGAAFHGTFTPWVIKLMRTNGLERNNDADAELRRDWAPEKVFQEYEKWSKRFLAIQPLLQHGPGRAIPIRLGEMGTYPARLLASALTFDHYVHLRYDLATALGPTFRWPTPTACRLYSSGCWPVCPTCQARRSAVCPARAIWYWTGMGPGRGRSPRVRAV